MLTVETTEAFDKLFEKLPRLIQKKALKQERLFRQNPFHPSLKTEKLEPKIKNYWSLRVDKNYRVIFRFKDSNSVFFLLIGLHDWIYKTKL